MSEGVQVALVSAAGLVLAALVGVLVELVRNRRMQNRVAAQAEPISEIARQVVPNNGSSLRDAVDRIGRRAEEIVKTQASQGERLAALEARFSEHTSRGER